MSTYSSLPKPSASIAPRLPGPALAPVAAPENGSAAPQSEVENAGAHNFARISPQPASPVVPSSSPTEYEADAAASASVYREGPQIAPRRSSGPHDLSGAVGAPSSAAARPSGGHPLAADDLDHFSSAWNQDLSDVRIHRDTTSAGAASRLNARAFAHGRDLFFGANQYAPERPQGRWLLAHELAHTVQFPHGPISREDAGSALPAPKQTGTVSRLVLIVHKRRIDVYTTNGVFSYELRGSNIPVGNYKAKLTVDTVSRTNKKKKEESYTQAVFQFEPIMVQGEKDKAPEQVEHFRFSWGPPKKKGQADFTDLISNSSGLSVEVTVNMENEIILEKDNLLAFNDEGENFTGNADPKEAKDEGGGGSPPPPKKEEGDGESTGDGDKKEGGGFGTGIDGGGPKANKFPFPSSVTGETEEVSGAIGAYTMRLDYTAVGPALIDQVGAASNWVNYKWEMYDVTQYVGNLAKPAGVDPARIADPDAREQTAEGAANNAVKKSKLLKNDSADASQISSTAAAGPRFQQAMEEQEENYRISQQRLQDAIQEGDVGKAFWNSINTNENVVALSAGVTAVGAGLTALSDLLGGPSSEQEIPWKNPGTFVIRVIASPKPIIEPEGPPSVHAPSVATLIVHVKDPQEAAKQETQRLDTQESKLTQAQDALKQMKDAGAGDDDPDVQKLRKQVEGLEAATTTPAAAVLGKIIEEKETELRKLRARYSGLKGYRPRDLRDLEDELDDLYEQRKHAANRVGAGAVRALGTLVSQVDGNHYTLLLQFEVVGDAKSGYTAKLSDITSPDGIFVQVKKDNAESAANAVIDKFAGQNNYGRGQLSIVVPAGGAGTDAAFPRISRSVANRPVDDKIAAQHLQNLAKAAAALAIVIPGAGELAAVIGAAASVENLARRARNDTLRPDSQAVADLANILGAAALGVTKIGGAIVARGSKGLTIAVKAGNVAEEANAVTSINRGMKIATAGAYAAKGIGYFQIGQFSIDTLEELKHLQEMEAAGKISHAEAKRRRLGIASAILQQTAMHASGAAEEARTKAKEQASGGRPAHEEGRESAADKRLKKAVNESREPEATGAKNGGGIREGNTGEPKRENQGGPRDEGGVAEAKDEGAKREAHDGQPVPQRENPTGDKESGTKDSPGPKTTRKDVTDLAAPLPPADHIADAEASLLEGMVSHPANPASRAESETMYKNSVEGDRTREAAFYYNQEMNIHIIVQGGPESAGVEGPTGESELPSAGRAQAWKELLNGVSEKGTWELLAHSHPNAKGENTVADYARMPSGGNGDAGILVHASEASGGAAKESRIDFMTANGPDHTIFRFDPSQGLPYTIDYPDPQTETRVEISFATMEEYHAYLLQAYGVNEGAVPEDITQAETRLLAPEPEPETLRKGAAGGQGGPAAPKKVTTKTKKIDPEVNAAVDKAFSDLENNPTKQPLKTEAPPVTARTLKQRIQKAWTEALADNPALRKADMTTIGREIHNYIAAINRRLAPSGWEVSVERKMGTITSVPERWLDLTVTEFFELEENGHLRWLKDQLADSVLRSKVRNLQPDMVLQGPSNQTIIWDLGSQESTSHLAKTLLYIHLLNGQGMSYVWESFWSASAK